MIIRPLEERDIVSVAALHYAIIRNQDGRAPQGLEDAFRRLFLDSPVAAGDLPSLVLESDGVVIGFQGVQIRDFEFEGDTRKLASLGPVFVAPEYRIQAAGAKLQKAAMLAGQDLTISDAAGEPGRKLWEMLGGKVATPQTIEWCVPLAPARYAAGRLARRQRRSLRVLGRGLYPFALIVDSLVSRAWNKAFRNPTAPLPYSLPLSASRFAEIAGELASDVRLRMIYTPRVAEYIFGELHAYTCRGEPIAREVRDSKGAIGWFIGHAWPDKVFRVMQLQAKERALPKVVATMIAEAARLKMHAVKGRIDGRIATALTSYRVRFSYGNTVLVHAKDRRILDAVLSLDNNISRVDGEWLMDIRAEPFRLDDEAEPLPLS